jgi:tetratricopeptide (TPR) repeat protein
VNATEPVRSCARLQPLFHLVLEGEAPPAEHRAVEAHLASCGACRREMERERALTALLDPRAAVFPAPRPAPAGRLARAARRLLPVGLLAAVVLAFFWLARGPAAYGSVTPTRVLPTLAIEDGARVPLRASNHLVVGPQEQRTVEIDGCGSLRIVGPATVELDRVEPEPGGEGWKLVLLRGQVEVELVDGERLAVASVLGARVLQGGRHVASLDPGWFAGGASPAQGEQALSAGELLARGHREFFEREDFLAAEDSYSAARFHPRATAEEQRLAHFYLLGAIGRQERYDGALALGKEYLEAYPEDEAATYVLFFQGVYLSRLGRNEEARAAWKDVIQRDPGSDLAGHARAWLGAPAPPALEAGTVDASGRARPIPPRAEDGPILVVALDLAGDDVERERYRAVAAEAARFHGVERVDLPASDLAELERVLRAKRPRAVLYALEPATLDVQLHRRLLLLSTGLDGDLFPDLVFGYLTAASAAELEALWARTREEHERGLSSRQWRSLFVLGSGSSATHPGYLPDIAAAAGFAGEGYGIAVHESDPGCRAYAAGALTKLAEAGVVTITGNGDPQGIWLFDDRRNLDSTKHWPYDPARVGSDAEAMPRLMAADFSGLALARPVVWSGTCHSAATRRVWVEGDIVSTFGATESATVHQLAPGESLGLALLRAGAVALLAPIGANHGYAVEAETEYALANGASLGDTIRSTWSDVFLQADGDLRLHFPRPGEPHDLDAEPIMQGGGANRVLIGDPTLRPFAATPHPLESVRVENAGAEGFDVVVTWRAGFHARSWDLYGTDWTRDFRVTALLPIDELLPTEASALSATVELTAEDGSPVPDARLRHVEVESWNERRFLHLQVNAPRAALDGAGVEARFRVRLENGG